MFHHPGQQEIGVNFLPIKLKLFHASSASVATVIATAFLIRRCGPVGRLNGLPAVENIQINIQDIRLCLEVIDADRP